jgi:hypothetical protein
VRSTKPVAEKLYATPSVTKHETLREITAGGTQCQWAKSRCQCFTGGLLGRFSIGM